MTLEQLIAIVTGENKPAYIGNVYKYDGTNYYITLKSGFYLLNEKLIFPEYPDNYIETSAPYIGRLPLMANDNPAGKMIYNSFRKQNVNTDIGWFSVFSIYNRPLSYDRNILIYNSNTYSTTRKENGYEEWGDTIGWTEPRFRAIQLTNDVKINSYMKEECNALIFLMAGNNVQYYDETFAPSDPGADLIVKKTLKRADGSDMTDMVDFTFKVVSNTASPTFTLTTNAETAAKKCVIDAPVGDNYTITETADPDGRYKTDEAHLLDYGGSLINGQYSNKFNSKQGSGLNEITIEWINVDTSTEPTPPEPPKTAKLTITKEVNSDKGKDKAFKFTATIGEKQEVFFLSNGQSKEFENIEAGTKFRVEEEQVAYFTCQVNGADGRVYEGTIDNAGTDITVTFINSVVKQDQAGLVVKKEILGIGDNTPFWFNLEITIPRSIGELKQEKRFSLSNLEGLERTFTADDFEGALSLIDASYTITEEAAKGYVTGVRIIRGEITSEGSTVTFYNARISPSPSPVTEEGEISGTGEKESRTNEITSDHVAVFRNFVLGYNSDIRDVGGVMDIGGHNFQAEINNYSTNNTTIKFVDNPRFGRLRSLSPDHKIKLNFICDGKQYDTIFIELAYDTSGFITGYDIFYGYEEEYAKIALEDDSMSDFTEWYDNKYKTIVLTNNTLSHDIYEWFKSYSDIDLSSITITITDGTCFAYGYVGHCQGREITFFPPAVEQYQAIYAEIDRSVIPNKMSIKTKNNQGSSKVLLNTFRQDALSVVKTGKFQVPLWFVKLSNKGIEELQDIRPLREYIDRVVYTERIDGLIAAEATVEGDRKPLDTNDKTVATTEWVQAVIEQEIRR